ncbi:MAG: formylglycine-generating enzyme family protein [Capsulimonadaceae bacterium]
MTGRAIVNRGDLLRLLLDAAGADRNRLAALCGFEPRVDEYMPEPVSLPRQVPDIGLPRMSAPPPPPPSSPRFTYLRATRFESLQAPTPQPPDRPFTARDLAVDYTVPAPELPPLMPYPRLLPYLRRAFGYTRTGRRADERRLLAAAARLDPICRIPRRRVPAWPTAIRIIADGRAGTSGFADDVIALRRRLEMSIGRDACPVYYLFDGSPTLDHSDPTAVDMLIQGYEHRTRTGRVDADPGAGPIRLDRQSRTAGAWMRSLPRAVPGIPDLVLSDLGFLDGDSRLIDAWRQYLRRQRTRLDSLTLLMPCPRSRWDQGALGAARAVCWDRCEHLPASRRGQRASAPPGPGASLAGVTALLNRIGPALHVEPGLLREARLAVGPELLDVGVEHDVRCHTDVEKAGATIAITPAKRGDYRRAFGELPNRTRNAVAARMRAWHLGYSIAYRLEEALNLAEAGALAGDFGTNTEGEPLGDQAARNARRRLRAALEQAVFGGDPAGLKEPLAGWLARSVDRASSQARESPEVAEAWVLAEFVNTGAVPVELPPDIHHRSAADMVARLSRLVREEALETPIPLQIRHGVHGIEVTPWSPVRMEYLLAEYILKHIEVTPWSPVRSASGNAMCGTFPAAFLEGSRITALEIDESGNAYRTTHPLKASLVTGPTREASPTGPIVTVGLHGTTRLSLETETARVDLAPWSIPAWASAAGCDEYGDYVEVMVGGVTFPFRWIPPGTFTMGSPEDEPGLYFVEGPLHPVTISRGFWLGSTPCTQEQWHAVTGANPSGFPGEDRPVETVSWKDCMEFCARLSSEVPGLSVRLPSEAEWEYACRAGTTSAFSDGGSCTAPVGADPALDRLGWYTENSEHGTHPVGRKKPNGWGLYDMHGNVWEWCLDTSYRPYDVSRQVDPHFERADGATRVTRGGSWKSIARGCRSACRVGSGPGFRGDGIGFRLLAGQEAEHEWQRRALAGSAEHVPRGAAPKGAPKATRSARKKR